MTADGESGKKKFDPKKGGEFPVVDLGNGSAAADSEKPREVESNLATPVAQNNKPIAPDSATRQKGILERFAKSTREMRPVPEAANEATERRPGSIEPKVPHAYLALDAAEKISGIEEGNEVLKKITQETLTSIAQFTDPAKFQERYAQNWRKNVNRPEKGTLYQEVIDTDLNSENGSFGLLFDFSEEKKEILAKADPTKFVSALVYEQLKSMTERRLVDDPIGAVINGKSHIALPKADTYYVVVYEGRLPKKVAIPAASLGGSFQTFHHTFLQLLRYAETIQVDFNGQAYKTAFDGRRTIQQARAAKKDLRDVTAADLSVVLANEYDDDKDDDEMSLDRLHRDKRNFTFGSGIPATIRIGVSQKQNDKGEKIHHIQSFGIKTAHAWADGHVALTEAQQTTDAIFTHELVGHNTHFKNLDANSNFSMDLERRISLSETTINGKMLRSSVNTLNEFFSQQSIEDPGITLTPYLILQYATMLSLYHTNFSHFIELNKQNALLGAALSVLPVGSYRFLSALDVDQLHKKGDIFLRNVAAHTEDIEKFIAAIKLFEQDRKEVRGESEKGDGIVPVMSTMTQGFLENPLRISGLFFDSLKTRMLTDTVSGSFLVGGKRAYQTHYEYEKKKMGKKESIYLKGFSGAFARIYKQAVMGYCDLENGDIRASIRLRRSSDAWLEQKFVNELQTNVTKILLVLGAYGKIKSGDLLFSSLSD